MGLIAALAIATSVRSAAAQDDLDELLSEEVVTTASKSSETTSDAPAVSTSVSAATLRRHGLRTLEDAVNFASLAVSSPGSNTHGAFPELGSRGVLLTGDTGNHFLVMIDGHMLNEPYRGSARFGREAGIPVEMIDHIEVIVGPGSVLYGSNAILGVINVITKRPENGARLVLEGGYPPTLRGGVGAEKTFRLLGDDASLSLQLDYFLREGPDLELGPQNLGVDRISGEPTRAFPGDTTGIWGGTATRSNYQRVPSALLRFSLGDFEARLFGRINESGSPATQGDFDAADSRIVERQIALDLSQRIVVSSLMELNVRAYADGYDYLERERVSRVERCLEIGVETCEFETASISRWAGLELRASVDWLEDGDLVTLVGVIPQVEVVGGKQDRLDADTRASTQRSEGVVEETTDTVLGAYIQQTWRPTDWLGFNAGGRIDTDPRFDPVFTPRLAVATNPWDGGTIKLIYAEAFRAPGRFETDVSQVGRLARPRGGLDPERTRSIELVLDQRVSRHRAVAGVFANVWEDLVASKVLNAEERALAVDEQRIQGTLPNTPVEELENVAKIESAGVNTGYEAELLDKQLTLGVNLTAALARKEVGGESRELTVAPRLFGNTRVAYALGDELPTLALAGFFVDERPANRAFDGGFTPRPEAPPQLELRANVSGDVPGVSQLRYRLSGTYRTASEGPYVLGPIQNATAVAPSAELNPIAQVETFLALEYVFQGEP